MTASAQPCDLDILHVEDNDDDAFIVARAFRKAGLPSRINRCRDGNLALAYFKGDDGFHDRASFPLPHLLLLDLKLPFRSGLEILRWLRSEDDFQSQVVVVLTSSAEAKDIEEANRLEVHAFVTKPASLNEMVDFADYIGSSWSGWCAARKDSLSRSRT